MSRGCWRGRGVDQKGIARASGKRQGPSSAPGALHTFAGVSFPERKEPTIATNDEQACVICKENRRNVCVVDCGHVHCCYDCLYEHVSRGYTKCPSCNGPMTKVINAFL